LGADCVAVVDKRTLFLIDTCAEQQVIKLPVGMENVMRMISGQM
jgi:hypothetical protein